MSNIFDSVPVPKKGRTNFNESHSLSGSFPLSQLIPVFCTETIPGDRWDINTFNLTKLETLIAPAIQKIDASLLWFKIPKRLLFKHFKKWYSGGEDGQDSHEKPHFFIWKFASDLYTFLVNYGCDDQSIQQATDYLFGAGSLWQYLGLPVPLYYDSITGSWKVRSLKAWNFPQDLKSDDSYVDLMYLMGYHMLFDQYFRDQSLSDGCFEDSEEGILKINNSYNQNLYFANNVITLSDVTGYDLAEGGEIDFKDVIRLLVPFKRAWKKDYFTSAQPNAQRGPEVTIGITEDSAPVSVTGSGSFKVRGENVDDDEDLRDNSVTLYPTDNTNLDGYNVQGEFSQGGFSNLAFKEVDGLSADLSGLSPITITAFRNLFKLQAFLEKNNVAGGRFIETILAHWAERVPDFTVQRAQHIRSTSIPVQISEVYATANSAGVNSQVGDQGGIAKTRGNLGRIHIYTQEPSIIYALYNVTCPPSYATQGIHRMFQRRTRFDEPWRDFQHIGEQAIKSREIFFNFVDATKNNLDFGYQQRFSEFKYMPDRVVGDFTTSLAYWHMARMFSQTPSLNEDFVTQTLDERIFAVQNVRPVIADFFFQAKAKRKLSKFSTPKLT